VGLPDLADRADFAAASIQNAQRSSMSTIETRLQAVHDRIARAADAAGRHPDHIRLIAVSKTFSAQAVRDAAAWGQRGFGENYAQEGIDKMLELRDPGLEWHFIGPIQSNKTRLLAAHFHWVQSVDRLKVAERLAQQRPPELAPLQVCIQVNVSGEATKSGVEPSALVALGNEVAVLPGLRLRGLMTIPAPTPDLASQRRQFRRLRELRDELADRGLPLDTLSMGMSDDLEAAIAEGATMVRVGRAIFGERR
jgi:PLP dependent protein